MYQDAQWCAAFVRYLRNGYQADLLKGSDEPGAVKSAIKLQARAHVFFDFWADLTGGSEGDELEIRYMTK
jgi:hypothetical protein